MQSHESFLRAATCTLCQQTHKAACTARSTQSKSCQKECACGWTAFVNTVYVSTCTDSLMYAPFAYKGILQFKMKYPDSESCVSDVFADPCSHYTSKNYSATADTVIGITLTFSFSKCQEDMWCANQWSLRVDLHGVQKQILEALVPGARSFTNGTTSLAFTYKTITIMSIMQAHSSRPGNCLNKRQRKEDGKENSQGWGENRVGKWKIKR